MLLMAIGTMTMYVYYATVYAAIQDVIEPRLRGTAVAIYFCAMYVLGASLGPLGMGMLSDHFAHQAMRNASAAAMTESFKAVGLHSALYIIPILAVLASLVLFAASRTIKSDIRKQRPNAATAGAWRLAPAFCEQRLFPFITTLHGTDITLVGMDRSFFPITKFSMEKSVGITCVTVLICHG